MFFKKRIGFIKIKIFSGKANPSPPIGPSLGQKGLNIIEFCKNFNNKTAHMDSNHLLNVLINYYSDKSYDFFLKNPSISFYLKKIIFKEQDLNFDKNFLNFSQLMQIVKFKINDFNSYNINSCIKTVTGVLKSMNFFWNLKN